MPSLARLYNFPPITISTLRYVPGIYKLKSFILLCETFQVSKQEQRNKKTKKGGGGGGGWSLFLRPVMERHGCVSLQPCYILHFEVLTLISNLIEIQPEFETEPKNFERPCFYFLHIFAWKLKCSTGLANGT